MGVQIKQNSDRVDIEDLENINMESLLILPLPVLFYQFCSISFILINSAFTNSASTSSILSVLLYQLYLYQLYLYQFYSISSALSALS
jgi:hypothetical protein